MSAQTADLFELPDFDEDEDDEDFQPPVKVREKKKPVIDDDAEEDEEEDEEKDKEEDDDEEDEDYDEEDNNEEGEDDDDEDDEEITLQKGKAAERKGTRKDKESNIIAEKPKGTGQKCANVGQATEFRDYIKSLMKIFEQRVQEGKQVKKYLTEMIDDIWEACMNMRYPGMEFDPEDIVITFLDPTCKAWQAMMKGIEFVGRKNLKEATEW